MLGDATKPTDGLAIDKSRAVNKIRVVVFFEKKQRNPPEQGSIIGLQTFAMDFRFRTVL
jgi:hypothetical protein